MGEIKKLESNRLILRKLKIEDAEYVFKTWTSDEETTKYMRWSTHKTIEETKQWILYEETNCESGMNYTWGIELKETGKLIGSLGANYKEDEDRYEIGYIIAKEYWRKGYTTEATKCMMNYLTNELGIKKFMALHSKQNPASGAVMRKIGMRYVGDACYEKFDKSAIMESKKYYLDIEDNIKKAKIDDSTEIAKLIKSSWNFAYKGLISDDFLNNMDIKKLTQAWEKNIIQNSDIYVYKEENEILGIIKYGEAEEKPDFGEILVFYVKPEEKRKGLGTKLWNFAKQELIKQGYKNILVWCLKGNKQGTNFYEKMKGEYIGEREANVNGLKIKEIGFKYNLVGDMEMEEIILVKPTKEYEEQAIEYKQEYFNNGNKGIHAAARWDKLDNYDEWLNLLKEHSSFETIKDNWTVHTTFFGIRKNDNKIIGMIDIRHDLTNDFLRNYAGHIGYSVRPSERKKGYATQMLNKALDFCKNELKLEKVMVNCNKENESSRKTILKAGGVLEKENITEDGENILIHWIKL